MSDVPVGDDERAIDLRRGPAAPDRDTRERLVRAAAEVFREQGYPGSRVQDIARRAGFTSGALYSHFDSRAELLAEAIAVENSNMLRSLSEGLGSFRSVSPSEIAAALAQFVALEHSPTDQLMLDGFAICSREVDARDRIGDSLRDLIEQLERRLDSMSSEPGSQIADDPAGVAYLLVAFVSGVTALRAAGLSDQVPADIADVLTGFLRQLGAVDDLQPAPGAAGPLPAAVDGPA